MSISPECKLTDKEILQWKYILEYIQFKNADNRAKRECKKLRKLLEFNQ